MKKIFSALILLAPLFFFFASTSLAATVSPTTTDDKNGETVSVTFSGLSDVKNYFVCLAGTQSRCFADNSTAVIHPKTSDGIIQINVCGNGDTDVKVAQNNGNCDPSKDYFHPGNTYYVRLYGDNGTGVAPDLVDTAQIPVSFATPTISLTAFKPDGSADSAPTPNDTYQVTIKGFRGGGPTNNDYQLLVKKDGDNSFVGPGSQCVTLTQDNQGFVLQSNSRKWSFETGSYTLYLNDQINDTNGKSIFECSGGQTLATVPFKVDPSGGQIGSQNTLETVPIPTEAPTATPPLPPCADWENGKCLAVLTAVGNVGTEAPKFITSIMSLLLGLSGGIAVFIIIITGYRLMTSQGEAEKIKEAREGLTSAVVGLLFIIFAITILQIIGANILHIPGFGN